jgi:hypothetical protein
MAVLRDNSSMRQLQLFTTAELGRMRDRRRRVIILRSVTSFAAYMPTIALGALCSVMGGACVSCAPARALLDRPARRTTAGKLRLWSRPRLWSRLQLWSRLRCHLSSGNAQRRRRSNSDDPRCATSPRTTRPRATSTSQPVSSPCLGHHTLAPRRHLPGPASRRLPTQGAAQSVVLARTRTRSHQIRTDPRRNRRHPRHRADQTAMPRSAGAPQDHHDTIIDKPGKEWQAARSTLIRTR